MKIEELKYFWNLKKKSEDLSFFQNKKLWVFILSAFPNLKFQFLEWRLHGTCHDYKTITEGMELLVSTQVL